MRVSFIFYPTIFLTCLTVFASPFELFLSPVGNDTNPGTEILPLKTLNVARDKAVANKTKDGFVITLLNGTYAIDSTFTLTSKHSGTNDGPFIFQGKDGCSAKLTGSVELKYDNSKPCDNGDVKDGVNPEYITKIRKWSFKDLGIIDSTFWSMETIKKGIFPQIYCNDSLMKIAQWPDTGYSLIDSVLTTIPFVIKGQKRDSVGKFLIKSAPLKQWVNETSHIFLYGYWAYNWDGCYEILDGIDTLRSVLITKQPNNSIYGYMKGQRFYAGNLICQINNEGEWAVNPATKTIYFWVPEKMKKGNTVITVNKNWLVSLSSVSNVIFRNIEFKNIVNNAIQVNSCTSFIMSHCIVQGIGGNGINLVKASNVIIDNCSMNNIGKAPITISGGDRDNLIPSNIIIANNIIHDFEKITKTYAPAINMGAGSIGCKVVGNTIYNAPHSAIIFWGNNHVIENNYIYNVCTETQDAGVLYAGRDWSARGTIIKNNFIENCGAIDVNAIYLDNMACGVEVYNNVIVNVARGFLIGGGRDNVIKSNLVVNPKQWIVADSRGLDSVRINVINESYKTRLFMVPFTDSIWAQSYPALLTILQDNPGCPKGNIVKGNTIVNANTASISKENLQYGIFDSNMVVYSNTFYPPFSKNFGVQKNVKVDTISPVSIHRMPVLPLVRSIFSKPGILYIECVPSCHSNHLKASIVNLRTRNTYNRSGTDTVAFTNLVAGDYVYSIWYTDIPFQDSTFSAQDTIHFTLDGSLSNKEIFRQPENPCILGGAVVDSATIALFWKIHEIKDFVFDSIGLWYNEFGYPGKANDSGAGKVGVWDLKTTFDTIRSLKPDKLYYFSIFGRDTAGNWTKTSDSAKLQIRTLKPAGATSGHPVHLQKSEADSLFSDTLVIHGDELDTPYIDTVDRWDIPFSTGFMVCGPPFSFRNGTTASNVSLHFEIKFHIPGTSYTAQNTRLYRFNVNTMAWRLDTTKLTYDLLGHTLYFSTDNLFYPFAVMIDTLAPKVNAYFPDTVAYTTAEPICDTFTIRDNIENLQIKLLAGSGGKPLGDISFFITPQQKTGAYTSTIPAYVADPATGLRAFLEVSDNRFSDTINLSRKIVRTGNNCDNMTIPEMEWTPVSVTAQLNNDALTKTFSRSTDVDTFTYDSCQQRIMRWFPTEANNATVSKWVEFTPGTADDFTFTPGNSIWIKSKKKIQITFDTAVIPALIDTFDIVLKKGVWTDFSLPYNFDIYAGDIFSATGKKDSLADSIQLHGWLKSQKTYSTDRLFLQGSADASDSGTVVKAASPLIALNNDDHDITLRIPPVSLAMSRFGLHSVAPKKKASSRQWSVKIGFRDDLGAELSPVYCLSIPENGQPRFFQAAPTFTPVRARILDKKTGKLFGHAECGELSSGGTSFTISCENQSDQPSIITATIDKITELPSQTKAVLYFKDEQFDTLANSCSMTVTAKQKVTGYLIVGTGNYINKFIKSLNSVFSFKPFTFNNVLRIRYSLPVEVKKMTTSIFDLKGRCLKRIIMTSGLIAGEGVLTLDSRFASGYYVVQMKIETVGSSKPGVLNRRWMLVR